MRHPKPVAVLATCLAFLAALVLPIALAGCSDSSAPKTGSSATAAPKLKEIVVGYESYPPYCYLGEDGTPLGIDMEIATEAFRRMGYRPTFKSIVWTDKDDLLASGAIDCIWCCFSMEGREDDYTWAGPYLKSDEVVAVTRESTIRTLADLNGKTIGVAATSKPESILLNHTNPDVTAPKRVFSLQDSTYLYTSLGKGYVDAIVSHRLAVVQYEKDNDTELRILDEPLGTMLTGVAFAKETTSDVPEKLSRMFVTMQKDGSMRDILAKHVDDPQDYLLGDNDV